MQQPYYTLLELQRAVEQCNWRKGYGSVCDIRRFGDGRLEVEISRPHMNKTVRFGRVRYNRVFFAGTSAKIRIAHPNASLIAAAPKLLEEAIAAEATLTLVSQVPDLPGHVFEQVMEDLTALRFAIAKATGGES